MKHKLNILLTFLFLFLIIGLVSSISYPHNFRGIATHNDGELIPTGYVITGGIGGIITGYSEISNGFYELTIESSIPGGVVEFFINGEKMDQEHSFESLEVTDLNLTIDQAPESFEGCGDNVCSEIANECSFCLIDCSFSECSNNGQCDVALGETCLNSPEDCGACPDPGNGGNSGGSGGGSGGGNSVIQISGDGDSNKSDEIKTIEELNDETLMSENRESEEPKSILSSITGAVVGMATPGKISFVGVFIALIIFMFIVSKRKKSSKKLSE
ncbi:hypothetical protein HN532_04200 [archaeon]|nr:hypothetical protein [archaeon]